MRSHGLWRRQPILPQARRGRSSSPCRKGKSPGEQPHIPSQSLGGVQLGCTPRVGGSDAWRLGHPAAAQMCLFDLGVGEGASSVTVGPSPWLLPAGASLQPCLQSRGPGNTSRKLMLPAWGGGQQSPEALLGVPLGSRLQQQMPSQPGGLGKEWQLRCRGWKAKREPLTAAYYGSDRNWIRTMARRGHQGLRCGWALNPGSWSHG